VVGAPVFGVVRFFRFLRFFRPAFFGAQENPGRGFVVDGPRRAARGRIPLAL
jgi:hypothetical protein